MADLLEKHVIHGGFLRVFCIYDVFDRRNSSNISRCHMKHI